MVRKEIVSKRTRVARIFRRIVLERAISRGLVAEARTRVAASREWPTSGSTLVGGSRELYTFARTRLDLVQPVLWPSRRRRREDALSTTWFVRLCVRQKPTPILNVTHGDVHRNLRAWPFFRYARITSGGKSAFISEDRTTRVSYLVLRLFVQQCNHSQHRDIETHSKHV